MSKIVIIDDNTLIARTYESNLIAAGHEVKVAFDGAAGLQTIKEFKPDLALLDLMLPGMTGIEVIRDLRSNPEFAGLPMLAYSGGDEAVLDSAREAGASIVISKKESSLKKVLQHLDEMLSPDEERVETIDGPEETPAEDENAEKPFVLSDERVLIVEDDLLIASIARDIIEKAGYQAVVAENGRDAYRILAKDANFAAGIFDVHVPYIEGTDLLRHMRTEKRLMAIPVMIMTTEETVRVQLNSLSAGATVFLQKPFERSTFEAMFTGLVARPKAETARSE